MPPRNKEVADPLPLMPPKAEEWQHIPLSMYSYGHPDHSANEADGIMGSLVSVTPQR